MRAGPTKEFQLLKRFIQEIEAQFLKDHLAAPTLTPPSRKETLDVAAYVILAHGSMENFIEGVGLWAIGKVANSWTLKKRATRCTASLLLYRDAPESIGAGVSIFDNVRFHLQEAKTAFANNIEKNNGIATKHLRTLFGPLGIDIPADPVLSASLESLVNLRHQWAHQYRFGAKVVKTAQDARQTVADCVRFAELLSAQAKKARP
jgi:hypothetical protein